MGINSTLTDDQEQVLFHQHLGQYERGLAVFKKAQADLRNIGKKAAADLGPHAVALLKIAISLREDDDGSEKLQARLEREMRVARWMGLPVGSQASLFDTDRSTAEDRAELEGFAAGSDKDSPRKPPEKYGLTTPQAQSWFKGYDRAQQSYFDAMEKKGTPVLRSGAKKPSKKAPVEAVTTTVDSSLGGDPEPAPEDEEPEVE